MGPEISIDFFATSFMNPCFRMLVSGDKYLKIRV